MAKILGLDLGTNSIGWALTEQTEDGYRLIDKGVSIFQEGVAREKNVEKPAVQERTDARALRRHYFRRRLRKIELLKVLVAHDLCPTLSGEQLDAWRHEKRYPTDEAFLHWQRTDDNSDKNPYHDRHVALTERLDLTKRTDRYLLGRALYHLSQRRGFLSNRKDQSEQKEDGVVKEGIGTLNADMAACGCAYAGEYFYRLYREGGKIRNRYTSRKEHFEHEFEAICSKQQLSEELRAALRRAVCFQRPLKSQKGQVGSCTFEKGKPRCPISHPRFEEFRMRSFINNIRVKTSVDDYRPLTTEEVDRILPLFYRKSKERFDFEEIAKAVAGRRKEAYSYREDRRETPYKFNYRMSASVPGCPLTAQLRQIFGDDWLSELGARYTKGAGKSEEQILNDVWHVLFSFDDDDKLRSWGRSCLQLSDEEADAFVKISLPRDYAALCLNAINKILPFLRAGYRYDEAVFLANLSAMLPQEVWTDADRRNRIVAKVAQTVAEYVPNPYDKTDTKERAIYYALRDCGLADRQIRAEKMYHPSMIETYRRAQPDAEGVLQLGSPRTAAVRNPMAMRALFRLRALVNRLLRDGKIDRDTKINIEFARGLNNANKRKAIEQMNREAEMQHRKYADEIRKLYFEACGAEIVPTETDMLKYQLWEEQKHRCLYTGETIGIAEFLGSNPKYDIEHTVPRSRGGDNSQMNKTLCQCRFNREVKREKLPAELAVHAEVMARIEALGWEAKIADLHKQIQRTKGNFATKELKDRMIQKRHRLQMELDYWRGKYERFTMTEVPDGFANRQGVDIGIISKYARLYLKSVFDRIYVVKGATTADFRKAWGLQEAYAKKERVNHVHHCLDAITIACIGGKAYREWARYASEVELSEWNHLARPSFPKPWPTFTEDALAVADELLVSHHTPDNMLKHSRKKLRVRGRIQYNEAGEVKYMQGDTARAALHLQTFYGAIKRDDEVKYVVRKALDALQPNDVDKIVDEAVRDCVRQAIAREGFKEAISKPICFNAEKGVYIKKVRIFTPSVTQPIRLKKHRDESRFEYKRNYHVANDGNYCMAIYEGTDAKGRIKRSFRLLNNLETAKFLNRKTDRYDLVPQSDDKDYPLKWILRTGTMVLFYENSPEELYECSKAELAKRLYKVTGMSTLTVQGTWSYGSLTLRHHQEARPAGDLKAKNGVWKIGEAYRPVIGLYHTQLNAYIEGYDFTLTVAGEVQFKH